MGADWQDATNEPQAAVWKYELHPGVTVLDLPVGASVLHVAAQGSRDPDVAGGVFLWALVIALRDSPTGMAPVPTTKRAFLTVGTGWREHPAAFGRYVGTSHLGDLVFHTFETAVLSGESQGG